MKCSWRCLLPLLVLGLAFGLRLYHLDFQSIWWDEGHSLFVASYPIPQIPILPAMDVHPPAYFTLLHLWMGIAGQSEFALRYLSVIFSLLTVALIWRFAASLSRPLRVARFASPPHHASPPRLITLRLPASPLLASLLAALSPLYVAYAQEARSYAMITCLTLASTYLLWRIIFTITYSTTDSRWSVVGGQWSAVALYIFLTAACFYTHYFTIFLLLFHNLAWLVWTLFPGQVQERTFLRRPQRVSRLVTWLVAQFGMLLLFLPQLLLALRQVTSYTNPNLTPPSLSEFISRSWQAYTVGLTIDPGPAQGGMAAIAGVIIIAVIYLLTIYDMRPFGYLRPSHHASRFTLPVFSTHTSPLPPALIASFLFLLGWFVIPLAAYFVVLQRQPSFEPRYMILVTPALLLLLATGVDQGARHTSPRLLASRLTLYLLAAVPVIVFSIGLYSYYTNETYFKDDAAGLATWLATETTKNDVVYVDVPHPFHYYVAQRNIAAPARYLFVDIHTAATTLTHEAAGRDRLFWITWHGSDTDPRGVIPFLAQKYGPKLGEHNFRGYDVQWFSLPGEDTVFSLPPNLNPVSATFGEVLRLDGAAYGGYPAAGNTTSANHPAWATLHFTLLRETEVDYKVSVRLRGKEGPIVSQVDKDLLNDRHFRTSAWPLPDPALNQAVNVYTLPLAPATPPGSYRLEVVIYNAQPPYPSEGVTGLESVDEAVAVIGHINVIP